MASEDSVMDRFVPNMEKNAYFRTSIGLLVVEFGLGEESLGKGGAVVVGSFESTNELRLDAQVTE